MTLIVNEMQRFSEEPEAQHEYDNRSSRSMHNAEGHNYKAHCAESTLGLIFRGYVRTSLYVMSRQYLIGSYTTKCN